ncbi:unnamed protein product [Prunus armeniaca]|uniref:Uncharacterized protein n=1 Tax=Prunus armeniaca TaxID=36596 RepID=A0A6J5WJR5_PRUAR|nr:unnamed protein product [Prunus armeniaca]
MDNEPELPCVSLRKRQPSSLALPRGALLQVPQGSRGEESGDCVPSLTGGCDSMDVRHVRALPQLGFMVAYRRPAIPFLEYHRI